MSLVLPRSNSFAAYPNAMLVGQVQAKIPQVQRLQMVRDLLRN
jgi:hypothetical protein